MRYTKSKDGIERVSVRVIIRLDRNSVAAVRKELKETGGDSSDKAVREFVASLTDYYPFSHMHEEEAEDE